MGGEEGVGTWIGTYNGKRLFSLKKNKYKKRRRKGIPELTSGSLGFLSGHWVAHLCTLSRAELNTPPSGFVVLQGKGELGIYRKGKK